jgi:hypothetical protein
MKRIFLLGGHDLEMITIRELLEEHQEVYYDKQLRWNNALLSAYQDVLTQYGNKDEILIYGIELRLSSEMEIYTNYILIDHHNKHDKKPAALIQIARLLGCKLTRFQELVAANDSSYIPGMKQMGASVQEIAEIRRRDRSTQGITENDELLAEQSIREQTTRIGDLVIVQSKTSHFSTICDRLYPYKKLLIYTDTEWMYYGEDVEKVIRLFPEEIKSGSLFYGGGSNGFTGVDEGVYLKENIEQMKDRIIETITK